MREHGDTVLLTFAVTHEDAPRVQVEVLDAKASTLQEPQASAVEQAGHEERRARHASDGSNFFAREHDWKVVLGARPAQRFDEWEL
jgi:hypothetical protein